MKSNTSDKTRFAQKRGQGILKDYKPWILVHEISSSGVSWRIRGRKTGRVHHLLSTLEKLVFLHLDSRKEVLDIREQFPLSLDETLRISDSFNIKHGQDQGEFKVMTSDFLIDLPGKQIVLSVKPRENITRRVVQKFQIEWAYWREQNVDFFVVTEEEIANLTNLTIWNTQSAVC
jgi:hypothetical protein